MLRNQLVIYDGNCPVCINGIARLIKLRLLPAEKATAFDELPEALRPKVDSERFRNEMALIDLGIGATLYGADAALHLFGERLPFIAPLLRTTTVRWMVGPLYKTIAFNRYVLSTPVPRPVRCACEPISPSLYRYIWLAFSALISVIITAGFGASASAYFPSIPAEAGAGYMLAIAGTGWVATLLFARFSMENWLEYSAHLGSVMLRGVLILLPFILWESITHIPLIWLPMFSVLLSSLYMFRQHRIRTRYLLLPNRWQWIWFSSLQLTALSWGLILLT